MPTMMVTVVAEMMGEVTLWAGTDPLTMAPQVGDTITGAVMDPDGGVDRRDLAVGQDHDTGYDGQLDGHRQDPTFNRRRVHGERQETRTTTCGVMATYTDAAGTDTAMDVLDADQ